MASKRKTKPNIVYNIFDLLYKEEVNNFWKNLFFSMACGKFPKKYSYNSGILNYKNGNKIMNSIEILEIRKNTLNEVKYFFEETGFLIEKSISTTSITSCDDLEEEQSEETWKKISKRKIIRNIYLHRYFFYLKEKYNLNEQEFEKMVDFFNKCFFYKIISNDDIIFEQRKIIEIEKVKFDNTKRIFSVENMKISIPTTKKVKPENQDKEHENQRDDKIMKKWLFFLKNYKLLAKNIPLDSEISTEIF